MYIESLFELQIVKKVKQLKKEMSQIILIIKIKLLKFIMNKHFKSCETYNFDVSKYNPLLLYKFSKNMLFINN